ncbi:MAG: class I SAM-dependent methyltransferase [Anaerolineales bacterium]|nr:class I SAM-dependent methyltransferase [Anaerolineales bacterium]
MEQDLNKIGQAYDSIAIEYAEKFLDEHEKKPMDQEILHRFVQEIGDKKPIWDFGCGPGQTTKYLKNLGVEISGLDLSEKNIEQASLHHPEINFHQGNMLALDFDNGSLAGVVAFYAIVHFSEKQVEKAFHEIYRVLRPGGLFLLTFHLGNETMHIEEFLGKPIDINFMFFTVDFISDCLAKCKFEKIEMIEREHYPEVEYESRRAYVFARKPGELLKKQCA